MVIKEVLDSFHWKSTRRFWFFFPNHIPFILQVKVFWWRFITSYGSSRSKCWRTKRSNIEMDSRLDEDLFLLFVHKCNNRRKHRLWATVSVIKSQIKQFFIFLFSRLRLCSPTQLIHGQDTKMEKCWETILEQISMQISCKIEKFSLQKTFWLKMYLIS